MWSLIQHVSVWPISFGTGVFLNVAPMFHIWGLGYATWVPIFTAGTLVMIPRYDPDEILKALAEHRVSIFAGGRLRFILVCCEARCSIRWIFRH